MHIVHAWIVKGGIMTYKVRYRRVGGFFWKKINKVTGDGFIEGMPDLIRYFILEDNSRIEVPAANTVFIFSKERYEYANSSK